MECDAAGTGNVEGDRLAKGTPASSLRSGSRVRNEPRAFLRVPGRLHRVALDHQDHRSLRGARSVHDAVRHHHAFIRA